MIEYFKGPYGANLLFRWHGSALAKAFVPGLLSAFIYLLLTFVFRDDSDEDYLNHPYAIGVLVSSVMFLIIFRANYGYQRYWEACGAVHQLMSKWMDATSNASIFHLQSSHYSSMKPPSFFDHDDLNRRSLTRDRETSANPGSHLTASTNTLRRRRYVKSINETEHTHYDESKQPLDDTHLIGQGRLDGGWGLLYPNEINGTNTATYYDVKNLGDSASKFPLKPIDSRGFASTLGGRTPSLFLQELAHLSSLLCAVALTTLRNDLDDVESPLDVYIPGQPWPVADPSKLPSEVKKKAYPHGPFLRNITYILGMDQTKPARTVYNAARPMLVIGGVSDVEIAFLQRARGPYAKTQLVWSWLSDFIIREHLAGSLGNVGPPIVSRIVQFLSDGMIYYNHARKIMFTPFPFPHAQLSAFFVLMMVIGIPFLMNQYANEPWLGASLSFLTVTCLAGLHEVARELENPFRNAPNDVPLCTLLALYNEALVTMFAGFHPDAYWDKSETFKKHKGMVLTKGKKDDDTLPELSEETTATLSDDDETPYGVPDQAAPQSIHDEDMKTLLQLVESQSAKILELRAKKLNKERNENEQPPEMSQMSENIFMTESQDSSDVVGEVDSLEPPHGFTQDDSPTYESIGNIDIMSPNTCTLEATSTEPQNETFREVAGISNQDELSHSEKAAFGDPQCEELQEATDVNSPNETVQDYTEDLPESMNLQESSETFPQNPKLQDTIVETWQDKDVHEMHALC